ncbi:MAG TPA: hypothetical protein VF938_04240 [Candidatus Angelobacter sp.]
MNADGAVVEIVKAELAAIPPGVTELGENVQAAPAGNPEQARVTAAVNPPPSGETLME